MCIGYSITKMYYIMHYVYYTSCVLLYVMICNINSSNHVKIHYTKKQRSLKPVSASTYTETLVMLTLHTHRHTQNTHMGIQLYNTQIHINDSTN